MQPYVLVTKLFEELPPLFSMNDDQESFGSDNRSDDAVDAATFTTLTFCEHCRDLSWNCDCANEIYTAETSLPASSELVGEQPPDGLVQACQELALSDNPQDREYSGSRFEFESWGMEGHLAVTSNPMNADGDASTYQPRRCPYENCRTPSVEYFTKKEFNRHYRWHKKVKKCKDCRFECVKQTDLNRHRYKHLKPDEKQNARIKCGKHGCPVTFTLEYNKERHLISRHRMSKEQAKAFINA